MACTEFRDMPEKIRMEHMAFESGQALQTGACLFKFYVLS
ncbi:hypothetical protein Cst_c13900 [Thermoclostridium stercorarium subsp. stercorarium DSM 8532]|uniref:Uncharacterized protein n=1 Tax=Thermoclostridium stercorarium (strain ATCC 35414 / DSM 8532 / NCIMB 11754) TaxID=1121335 RepID=L7VPK6_THES1|nr:hypothetical protein Cst_c13900 [Thermoclostridium stercorarium subsp. stercorarium DSM 8532]